MGLQRLLADPTNAALLQFLFDNEGKVLPAEHLIQHWENLFEVATDHALPLVERWEFDCEGCGGVTASDSDEAEACYFCGASLADQIPRHVVELQQMASDAELLGLLKERLTQVGLNEANFCIMGDHCQLHNMQIRLVKELRSIDDLFSIVDTAQPPLLIVTKRPPAQRPAAFARWFLLDVSVHSLLDFWFDQRILHDFVAGFARPATLASPPPPVTTQFQIKSPTIRNALQHLQIYGSKATEHMIQTMHIFLETTSAPITFFGTSLSRNDFLEHWVHLWLVIITKRAFKLGCIGKEAGVGNPKWPDGIFELPHKKDPFHNRTQYAYDATVAQDFDKEIEQAQTYLGFMTENFDWRIDYYYIISTACPSEKVRPRYDSLVQSLHLPAAVVFLSVWDMLTVLERLHGVPELWECFLCFELNTLFDRDKSLTVQEAADRRHFPYAVITPEEVERWLENLIIKIEKGIIPGHDGYQVLLRQFELVHPATILPPTGGSE